jgi:hypothetical protein
MIYLSEIRGLHKLNGHGKTDMIHLSEIRRSHKLSSETRRRVVFYAETAVSELSWTDPLRTLPSRWRCIPGRSVRYTPVTLQDWDSSVGIVITTDLHILVCNHQQRQEIFLSSKTPVSNFGAHPALTSMGTGGQADGTWSFNDHHLVPRIKKKTVPLRLHSPTRLHGMEVVTTCLNCNKIEALIRFWFEK